MALAIRSSPAALGGLLVGSFLNVVAYRLPRGESLVHPRSHCPGCGTPCGAYRQRPGALVAAPARALPLLRRADLRALPARRGDHGRALRRRRGQPGRRGPHRARAFCSSPCSCRSRSSTSTTASSPTSITAPAAVAALVAIAALDPDFLARGAHRGRRRRRLLPARRAALPARHGHGRRQARRRPGALPRPRRRAGDPHRAHRRRRSSAPRHRAQGREGGAQDAPCPFGPFLALGGIVACFVGDELVDAYLDTFYGTALRQTLRGRMSDACRRAAQVRAAIADEKGTHPAAPTAGAPLSPMAKHSKNLVGLDIDATGIVAASVRGQRPPARRDARPSRRSSRGSSATARSPTSRAWPTRCATLYRENKGLGKRVRVGVANQKIVVRVIELPCRRGRQGARRGGPLPRAGPAFRCRSTTRSSTTSRSTSSTTGPAQRQRVLLVAARRDMVERVLAALRAAGLQPEGIDLSAFAMIRALHRAGPEDERRPLPGGRRPDQPRRRARHHLHLHARLRRRRRGARRRARRAPRADPATTPTVARPRRRRDAVEDVEGDAEIVEEARQRPPRRRAPHRRRGAQLARLPPHARRSGAPSPRAVMTGPADRDPRLRRRAGLRARHAASRTASSTARPPAKAAASTVAAGLAVEEAPA